MPARGKENGKYQGAKWLSREKRLSLYIRDSLACVYCGTAIEDGAQLSLDHLVPFSLGGTHHAENLVTCCKKCNDSRGNRDWKVFARSVAAYLNHGITGKQIIAHIEATRKRPYDIKAAKEMIAQRGGFTLTLKSYQEVR